MKLRGKSDWRRLRRIREKDIGYSDIPPSTDEMLKNARRPGRPLKEDKKENISIRLDSDILSVLRKNKNWQTGVNDALRGLLKLQGLL
jgi:uncharacterized protein (DUF4415 family)